MNCLALFCIGTLFTPPTSAGTLKERFAQADANQYIVTEWDQTRSLIALRSDANEPLRIEEISLPSYLAPKAPSSWGHWMSSGAPHHTSWSMVEFDRTTGNVLECYSFSQARWIPLSHTESFFSTLLQLPLLQEPLDELRRIGPPPPPGEVDHRKIWIPPFHLEGQILSLKTADVFSVLWPEDGSHLSGEKILLYFDPENRSPFPFWIQANLTHLSVAIQVIDSGAHLAPFYSELPKRTPYFLGTAQESEEGIRLALSSPKYYRHFELFAIDTAGDVKEILEVPHLTIHAQGERVYLDIESELLHQLFKPDHTYKWLLMSGEEGDFMIESPEAFRYTQSAE